MQNIREFGTYTGEDGYLIVDSISGDIPGGKKRLTEVGGFIYQNLDERSTLSGNMLIATLEDGRYGYFANPIPDTVKQLIIQVLPPADNPDIVPRAMFEFMPESELDNVSVIDENEDVLPMASPMAWPAGVSYQGTVINGLANIIGYSHIKNNGKWLSTAQGDILVDSDGNHIAFKD